MRLIPTLFLFLLTGCSFSYFLPEPACPTSSCVLNQVTPPYCPLVTPDEKEPLALDELVDIALQNSPMTRLAWFRAKAKAAEVGIARGAFLPTLDMTGTFEKTRYLDVEPDVGEFPLQVKSYGAALSTQYLLFDFGSRSSRVDETCCALLSSEWLYNFELQKVMVQVIQNYYNFLNAKANVENDTDSLNDFEETWKAAEARRVAGAKSIADELQAKTQFLQQEIVLENDKGALLIAAAALSQSLGLSPESLLTVTSLPETLPIDNTVADVKQIFNLAKERRSDLLAARAILLEHRAKIKSAYSNFFPNLTVSAYGGKQYVLDMGPDLDFDITFNLNVPIFHSFTDVNTLREAQSLYEASFASLTQEELSALLTVATDYYEFNANTQVLKLSDTYLKTAEENRKLAFEDYQAGVTTILDLLIADNALRIARRSYVNSRTKWLDSLANLAFDTGVLDFSQVKKEGLMPPLFKCKGSRT